MAWVKYFLIITTTVVSASAYCDICNRTAPAIKTIEEALGKKCEDIELSDLSQISGELKFQYHDSKQVLSPLKGDFEGLNSVETVSIIENRHSIFPEGVFEGLSSLKTLRLTNIGELFDIGETNLSQGVFRGLSALEELSFEDSNLVNIPENVFEGLSSLKVLRIKDLRVTTFPEKLLNPLVNLQEIHIMGYVLSQFPDKFLAANSSLLWFDLQYTYRVKTLPEGFFDGLTQIQEISLTDGGMETLPENIFIDLASLHTLNLSNNDLSNLPKNIFAKLLSLQELHLSYNPLTEAELDQIEVLLPNTIIYF